MSESSFDGSGSSLEAPEESPFTTYHQQMFVEMFPSQLDMDKSTIYSHPLFPLLGILMEKCQYAMATNRPQQPLFSTFQCVYQPLEGVAYAECLWHPRSIGGSVVECSPATRAARLQGNPNDNPYIPNKEVDDYMLKSIQLLFHQLQELEKAFGFAETFARRYEDCLSMRLQKLQEQMKNP
ncbi:unnamed protein product [Caenorhabditis auriculariae]|uniref:MEIS N-terminal domain-containing protein n=1 Tax=Caenorhabditis auriculariae TaxID=2777116 RepID=A0A8S1HYI7_9PELO|nr:unnamed protein product [Caenorhabditis auriculariae]